MNTRPWFLYLLAAGQFVSAWLSIFLNAWLLKVPVPMVLYWMTDQRAWGLFETFGLPMLMGCAILIIRTPSYVAFWALMIWNYSIHYRNFSMISSSYRPQQLIPFFVGDFLLCLYLILPSVRTLYLDASIRWWQSQPRYEIKWPSQCEHYGKWLDIMIVNLSDGGCLISSANPLKMGDLVKLKFQIMNIPYEITGQIVHCRDEQYGVQFIHTPKTKNRFYSLAMGLKNLDFPERSNALPWWKDALIWLRGLLGSGKGIVPIIRRRRTG